MCPAKYSLFINKISLQNLAILLGGWANPEGCKRLQEIAAVLEKYKDSVNWDQWNEDFDRECFGI